MLIAYILGRDRLLRIKFIRGSHGGVFKKGEFEYKIDRDKIYQKKALFLKLFFFSLYLEGIPDPLEFTQKDYVLDQSQVPLNEIGILLSKLKFGLIELLMLVMTAVTLILVAYMVFVA